MIWGRCCI